MNSNVACFAYLVCTTLVTPSMAEAPKKEGLSSKQDKQIWNVLGLKLKAMSKQEFSKISKRYHSGVEVTGVRMGSSAEKRGIRVGDVLVGLHIWETVKLENVTYILDRPDFEQFQPLKFYVLRGSETFYGHLRAEIE